MPPSIPIMNGKAFLLFTLFCVLANPAQATPPPYAGLTLEEALLSLQERGVPLVFTSRVVRPDMRVEREPEADDPLEILAEILAPHGLTTRSAGGRLVVVAADQGSRAEEAAPEERTVTRFLVRDQIDVTSQRPWIGEEISQLQLGRERALSLPRLGDDVLRSLKVLPGTAGNDATARLSIRGGREDELMVRLDGLELYEAYHLKDYSSALSILPPETVGSLELLSGTFPVEFGDRMSGVLDIVTVDPDERRSRLGLSALHLQAQSAGTFHDRRGAWLSSLRAGSLEIPFQIANRQDNPRFGDFFLKLEHSLGARQSLRGNVLASGDRLHFEEDREDTSEVFHTSYKNAYAWLTHQLVKGRDFVVDLRASASHVERERDGETVSESAERVLSDERNLDALALAQDWRVRTGAHTWKWGFDVRSLDMAYDYQNERAGEAVPIFGDPGSTTRFEEDFRGEQESAYLADRLTLDRLTAEVGLRYDRNSILGDGDLSPRLQLSASLGPRGRFFAAWGHYTQSQRLYELQVEDGETSFARTERAEHRSAGLERTFADSVLVRAEVYERRIRHPRARWENLFEPISKVPELEDDRVRIAPSGSLARGLELFLTAHLGSRTDFFLSYTWSRVEDKIDGRDVPRSIDQPHAVKADFDFEAPWRWDLNLVLRYHTGWPTTAVGVRSTEDGEVVPVLGPRNDERLPDYFRADLRASRKWSLRRGELLFYVELQNLTNRKNVRGFDVHLEEEDEGGGIVKTPKDWGGILPSLGLAWSF